MTYRELLAQLQTFTEEMLEKSVLISNDDINGDLLTVDELIDIDARTDCSTGEIFFMSDEM